MSLRSEGKFPIYSRLDINPEEPPAEYFENKSRRCPKCNENWWPNTAEFSATPCCGVTPHLDQSRGPSMNWRDAVSALLTSRFEEWYTKYDENTSDVELTWRAEVEIDEKDLQEGRDEIDRLLEDINRQTTPEN